MLIVFLSGLASASTITLTAPYSSTTAITNAPSTWNGGVGFISWPVAPNANPTTGAAGFTDWARSTPGICPTPPNPPYTGSCHGTDNTEAGFNIVYTCTPLCNGDTSVLFNWQISWNYTMDLTCTGTVNNQFGVNGEVNSVGGSTWNYSSVKIIWLASGTVPTHKAGGGTNQPVTVVVSLTPALPAGGTYILRTWLFSEIFAGCAGATGYANSELQISSATLQSVVIT